MLAELRFSHVIAGFVAVLVGYASSAAIIFQASEAAGATASQAASWMLALGLGCAASSLYLSLRHRIPVLTAWSTPGAALLVVALPGTPIELAIGAFVFCGVLLWLTGITGWFEALTRIIPDALANAMLAGVLFRFGIGVFTSIQMDPVFVALLGAIYLLCRRFAPLLAIPAVLAVGCFYAVSTGMFVHTDAVTLTLARPEFVMPAFDPAVLIGVGVPLYIVTMSSQNMAGVAVLRGAGYQPPVSSTLATTGLLTTLLAPFGGFALNFAAITAAICAGDEAGEDPRTRYWAPVISSIAYFILALLGAAVIGFFVIAPKVFVAALAGLALLPTISQSLSAALVPADTREAALVTFLATVSGISFWGVAAPVWGLLFGAATLLIVGKRAK